PAQSTEPRAGRLRDLEHASGRAGMAGTRASNHRRYRLFPLYRHGGRGRHRARPVSAYPALARRDAPAAGLHPDAGHSGSMIMRYPLLIAAGLLTAGTATAAAPASVA